MFYAWCVNCSETGEANNPVKWWRIPGRVAKWCYYPARRGGGFLRGRPGSKAQIYQAASKLGVHRPVGLTHRKGVLYHEVPFPGLRLEYSRSDLKERLQILSTELEVKGCIGLDLGCAVGGLTFSLQLSGAIMKGVERDPACVGLARALESRFRTGAEFVQADVVEFVSASGQSEYDFVCMFSAFNWIIEGMDGDSTKKFLTKLGGLSRTFVMDSALGGKGQKNLTAIGITDEDSFKEVVASGLGSTRVRQIGTNREWYDRGLYVFER